MITRRIHGLRFLLHPLPETIAIIRYLIAAVARRYRIQIHAVAVLSDHWHACVTDPAGRVCDFTRDCHSTICRALNAEYGDSGSMWESQQTSYVSCVEPSDLVDKMVYTMANPVKHRLVRRGEDWPGIRCAWPAEPMSVERTGKFFDNADREAWPDTVTLEFARPPGYESLSDVELAAMIGEAVETREAKHREEARLEGECFMGADKVLEQSRYDTAASSKETRGESARKISPRVACKDKGLRIEWLARNQAWMEAYRVALEKWRAGDRDVEFPYGTYKMRVLHGARCAEPPI